jgi:glycosyltransferase involved in cell wall biosynthesis
VPKPRLCFFGTLGWWVNYDILIQFAHTHPNWSVVLIGPTKTDVSALSEIPNVVLLGAKAHAALPAYLHVMDVLCIPYLVDEFTRGVFPAKLFEALSTGKPMVATPITELMTYADVITITEPDNFVNNVVAALSDDTPAKQEARLSLARANSWVTRIAYIRHLLTQTLETS